jgi:hypothetical protein
MKIASRFQAAALVLGLLPTSVRGEDVLGWSDLQTRVISASASDRRCEFVVMTKSGEKYTSRYLGFGPAGIGLDREWFALPYLDKWIQREQVEEVLVRHRGRLSFGVIEHHFACVDDLGCVFDPIPALVLPIDLAFGLIATPPMLPIEAVRRIGSTRVLFRAVP